MERKKGGRESPTTQCFLLRGQAPLSVSPSPQSMWKMPIPQLLFSHAPPVTLEKHMSHLLAISIYLTAWVWLTWKTQSTWLSPLRSQPLLCNLQALWVPELTMWLQRAAEEGLWQCGWVGLLFYHGYKRRKHLFSLQWGLLPPPTQITTNPLLT